MEIRKLENIFRLTKKEYYADLFITPVLTLLFFMYSFSSFSSFWPLFIIAGIILWSLYEYILHRFFLHNIFPFTIVHALHHRNKYDYIAIPPWLTFIFYIIFLVLFGSHSSSLMIGFSIGYIIYSIIHTSIHFFPNSFLYINSLIEHHEKHHRNGKICFGVSSSFWDIIFNTI